MPLTNTPIKYGSVSKLLHWTVTILVFSLLIAGFTMGNIGEQAIRIQVISIHKLIGVLVFFLMLFSVFWALINRKPTLPDSMPTWEQVAARCVHLLLYIALIVMPLSGWIMASAAGRPPTFFNLFALPFPGIPASESIAGIGRQIHGIAAYCIVALLTVHILAALKHHFFDKNMILTRMLPEKCSTGGNQ